MLGASWLPSKAQVCSDDRMRSINSQLLHTVPGVWGPACRNDADAFRQIRGKRKKSSRPGGCRLRCTVSVGAEKYLEDAD